MPNSMRVLDPGQRVQVGTFSLCDSAVLTVARTLAAVGLTCEVTPSGDRVILHAAYRPETLEAGTEDPESVRAPRPPKTQRRRHNVLKP
jgi:hypothetical protein